MALNFSSQSKLTPVSLSNFTILNKLGKGSFGKVYLIKSKKTGEFFAMKQISKKNLTKEDKNRINREIQILSKLSHPNIVQMKHLIITASTYLIIMEYCPNGELFNYILKKKLLNETEASIFFYQLIETISYLHSQKVIHRDIKPENILLSSTNNIKLIDFGLSNFTSQNEMLSTACGSPCYAAPEMLKGKRYRGGPCDVWSAGVILYAMLGGYLPFQCDDDGKGLELYSKIAKCDYTIPSWFTPPAKVLIERILVPDPEKRITLEEIQNSFFFKKGKYNYFTKMGKREHLTLRYSCNFSSFQKKRDNSKKGAENTIKYIFVKKRPTSSNKKDFNKEETKTPLFSPTKYNNEKESGKQILKHIKNVVIKDVSACINFIRKKEQMNDSAFNYESPSCSRTRIINGSVKRTSYRRNNNDILETSGCYFSSNISKKRLGITSLMNSCNQETPVKNKVNLTNLSTSINDYSLNQNQTELPKSNTKNKKVLGSLLLQKFLTISINRNNKNQKQKN